MADQAHLTLIKRDIQQWNEWRKQNRNIIPDLTYADLSEARLSDADLSDADLSEAGLIDADLSGAVLTNANLSDANLSGANLGDAVLSNANLSNAYLSGANLSGATIGQTQIGDRDLRVIKGLETVGHNGPSPLSINTVYLSQGDIPEAFVRGTGAPDSFIEYMHALAAKPIEYYTCFISYSSKDHELAERLYTDLQSKGVRCWFAPEDLKTGDKIRPRIDESIRRYDKLLLILSEHSVASQWVEHEVETAIGKELEGKPLVLFPIRLDDTVMDCKTGWASHIRLTRHITDFSQWKHHDLYQKRLNRLLRDLKADTEKEGQ